MDEAADSLDKLAMHKAREGVASWLPTTVTAPLQDIHGALQRIAHRYHSGGPGAQVLGSYLEDRISRHRIKARTRLSYFGSWNLTSWMS